MKAMLNIGSIMIGVLIFVAIVDAAERITITQALEKAKKAVNNDPVWQIAFISNTGVTKTGIAEELSSPQDGLMLPNGKAGQWIIELYKDSPKVVAEQGRVGAGYPYQRVLVTANNTVAEPEFTMVFPGKLTLAMKPENIASFDAARKLAIAKCKGKFDVMSVTSEVSETGGNTWKFRFYNLKSNEMVDKINISLG